MFYLSIFITGLLIGSFTNVCIYRIPLKQSIVFPPSHCTNCNTQLKPIDLIPIFSYLFCRGKCKYCKQSISIQYPIIELLTGIVYLLLFIKLNFSIDFIFFSILSTLLIIMSGIDYKHQIIPNGIVLTILIATITHKLITYFYLQQPVNLVSSIIGFLIGGGFFLLIAIVSNGGMGGGDIKLIAILGFWLGWKLVLLTMFLSFILGSVLSIMLLLFKIKDKKEAIPFGPFIGLATLIVVFKGNELVYWYFNLIL